MREYILAPHYENLLSTWNFLSENFYQVAKGNTASLLASVMARKLYFPRAGISDLIVPASTERPSPYLLECFAQFFLFPKGHNYAVFPREVTCLHWTKPALFISGSFCFL